ncbi:hypothetical protein D018_1836A, partial [Vibrio parahaemolyticus VP2007-007]
MMASAPS